MARPKGRKNNSTLLREAAEGEKGQALKLCHGLATSRAANIILAMCDKAEGGDVAAAKVILDRVYPAMRQVDDSNRGAVSIQINITGDEHGIDTWEGKTIEQSYLSTDGEESDSPEGGEEFAEHAGEERQRPH